MAVRVEPALAPATATHRDHWSRRWTPIGLSWLGWSSLFGLLRSTASQIAFEYNLNVELLWPLLGPPKDIYSFANMALPHLIANAAISVPTVLFGLLVYRTFSLSHWRFNAFGIGVILVACLGFAAVARASAADLTQLPSPRLTVLFIVFLMALTAVLGWLMDKSERMTSPAATEKQVSRAECG